jgi:hypothetical protein
MASTLVTLAEAIQAALSELPALAGATVDRAYVPRRKLESMGSTLFVTVVPMAAVNSARLDRGSYRRDPTVDVTLQRRVASDAESDELVDLLDQVADHLWKTEMGGMRAISVDVAELFLPEHLDGKGVFTGVLRATYREGRSLS